MHNNRIINTIEDIIKVKPSMNITFRLLVTYVVTSIDEDGEAVLL